MTLPSLSKRTKHGSGRSTSLTSSLSTLFKRALAFGATLALLSPVAACSPTKFSTRSTHTDSTFADPALGVTVIRIRDLMPDTNGKLGEAAADCVTAALTTVRQARVITATQFQRSVVPEVSLASHPLDRDSLLTLTKDETFRARAVAAGVRYVVGVAGSTHMPGPDLKGLILEWQRASTLVAEIVDVASGESLGSVDVTVRGRAGMVLYVIPAGSFAFTETEACRKLGTLVVDFLAAPKPR